MKYGFEGSVSNIDLGWFSKLVVHLVFTNTYSRFAIAKFAKSNDPFRRC